MPLLNIKRRNAQLERAISRSSREQLPAVHTIRHSGKTVEIVALDLAEPPEVILEQIVGIAKRIREIHGSATVRAPTLAQAVM